MTDNAAFALPTQTRYTYASYRGQRPAFSYSTLADCFAAAEPRIESGHETTIAKFEMPMDIQMVEYLSDRERVKNAFKALRKTHQPFFGREIEQSDAETRDYVGFNGRIKRSVFGHGDTETNTIDGALYLWFSGDGQPIVDALRAAGCMAEWDGSIHSSILVTSAQTPNCPKAFNDEYSTEESTKHVRWGRSCNCREMEQAQARYESRLTEAAIGRLARKEGTREDVAQARAHYGSGNWQSSVRWERERTA